MTPFSSDPLFANTMNELQRVQQRALQQLPPQLRLDVFETDKELKVRADLPGVSDKDVQIHIDENNSFPCKLRKATTLSKMRLEARTTSIAQSAAQDASGDRSDSLSTLTGPK